MHHQNASRAAKLNLSEKCWWVGGFVSAARSCFRALLKGIHWMAWWDRFPRRVSYPNVKRLYLYCSYFQQWYHSNDGK